MLCRMERMDLHNLIFTQILWKVKRDILMAAIEDNKASTYMKI